VKLFCSKLWLCAKEEYCTLPTEYTAANISFKAEDALAIRHHQVSEEYKRKDFQTMQYELK
jgi:hypothetical protein